MVRVTSHDVASCPICLYEPVAAKITRCGHIYCWACILHYLALSDKTWRKCPICFEAVHKKDLKSVNVISAPHLVVGEVITMRLMQRVKGSVFAMAKSEWKDRRGQFLHLDEGNHETCFSKLLIATPKQVYDLVVVKEKMELQKQLMEEKHCPEACFIESAIQLLNEREVELLKEQKFLSALDRTEITPEIEMPIREKTTLPEGTKRIVYISAFDDEIANDNSEQINEFDTVPLKNDNDAEKISLQENCRVRYESTSTNSTNGEASVDDLDLSTITIEDHLEEANYKKDIYYFYQAADGQHAYMHALNIRMLVKEYGSLDKCPDTVTGRIVEKEGISMSEHLRKRLRYLCHLPLTREFDVVEVSLKPPIVSQDTIKCFAEEIEKRRRRRNKRAKEERRRERYIREEENRKYGIFPEAALNLSSHRQFPQYYSEEAVESPDVCINTSPTPNNSSPLHYGEFAALGMASTPLSSSLEDSSHSVPSFAQMLRKGKAKANELLKGPMHVSPPGSSETQHVRNESDSEDYVPAPEYHVSFGNAIQEALNKAIEISGDSNNPSANKKKKKKTKATLLFTTNMSRSK